MLAASPVPPVMPVAGGRSSTPIVVGLAIAAIIAVAAGSYVVLTPKAATTAAPSVPGVAAASRTPAGGQSASPAPSAIPSAAPEVTAAPAVTVAPDITAVAGKTCHSGKFGVTVTYPVTWNSYSADAGLACTLFDPKPFPVITDGSDPRGAIYIISFQDPFNTEVTSWEAAGKLVSKNQTTIDGKAAVVMEIDDTGVGVAPNGMRDYLYLIDIGTGTLLIGTSGISDPSFATVDEPYNGYKDNIKVVDSIARTLKFD
jgi:hypothetical protein